MIVQPQIALLLFYDAPTPPPGIFDAFLAIPFLQSDVSTRSYPSLVQSSPDQLAGTRYALQPSFIALFAVLTPLQWYIQYGFTSFTYPFTLGCRFEWNHCSPSNKFAKILTNTFPTVLGEQAQHQKQRIDLVRYRAIPSLDLHAQHRFDCIPTRTDIGLPPQQHRICVDKRNLW